LTSPFSTPVSQVLKQKVINADQKLASLLQLQVGTPVIQITDNGPGIPKEDLRRIFERFYRVDKSRSKDRGGIGLGLAIVKHILEAHHQKIWVTSELGKGSHFYFNLEKGVREKALVEEALDV